MNGLNSAGMAKGWPATAVVRVGRQLPLAAARAGNATADAALMAGVTFPPRVGEVKPIAALLPEVLARYGLAASANADDHSSIDCFA